LGLHILRGMTAASARSSIPVSLTRFIGRERELALVAERLRAGRLVTLVGPGGMGKTRLAIEAARAWADANPADVWFVDLSPVTDSLGLERAVAATLEVRDDGKAPLGEHLLAYLRAGTSLIVMDNCEQIVEVAADWAANMLAACPDARILATSREQLGIGGESLIEVPPLDIESEALPLFEDRARALAPSLSLDGKAAIARQICEQLDGMPLAIELAAARTRALSLSEINSRLNDRFTLLSGGARGGPERHRTLGTAVEWSYNLLPEKEATLYSRLSVFAGGCTLAAAETACSGDGIAREEVVDLLTHLVDRSLVLLDTNVEPARYRMLETMRAHAASRLQDADRWRQRHFDWVASLTEDEEPWLLRARELERLDFLSQERENFRTALRWAAQHAELREQGLWITLALIGLWWHRGPISEGEFWLQAFAPDADATPTLATVRACTARQVLREAMGEFPAARRAAEEGVAQARRLGDHAALAFALCWLLEATAVLAGGLDPVIDLYEEAKAAVEKTGDQYLRALLACQASFADPAQLGRDLGADLELVRASGDLALTGVLLLACGEVARERGEMEVAGAHYRESLEIRERLVGPGRGQTWLLRLNLAFIELMEGDQEAALPLLRTAFRNATENETLYGISTSLMGTGVFAALAGEHTTAARLMGAARRIDDSIGIEYNEADTAVADRGAALCIEGMGKESFEHEREAGAALATDAAIRLAEEFLKHATDKADHRQSRGLRPGGLSRQEVEVLSRLASGSTNREIAAELFLSVRTVENHIANAYGKINARGRAEATAWAIAHGLVAAAP